MQKLKYLAVLLLAGLCAGVLVMQEDACQPGLHDTLSQTSRSTGFDTRDSDSLLCDKDLMRGWYTFTGVGGELAEMATSCPDTDKCGTRIPLWLKGQHPTVEEGIVSLDVCGKRDRNGPDCCQYKDKMFVKNCGGFYIYYLNPTFVCSSAYCAGSAKRCPVGKWSNTDFEPCRDPAPVLQQLMVVTGPIVEADQSFHFQCEIVYGPRDADQVFEVVWTFNGNTDPSIKPQILTAGQRVATLSDVKLAGHPDTNVGCQVKTYFIGREKNKNTYSSKTNYFGVQAVKLSGPNVHGGKSFDFECELTIGSTDPNQRIEVAWTFNGRQVPDIKAQVISGQERKVILDGTALQGRLNTNVGCQARLIYERQGIRTLFKNSNTYFAGIQVNPGRLDISDTEGQKEFTVISTVPVVCDQGTSCCVAFTLTVDKKTVVSIKDSCNHKICASDWDDVKKQASFTVTMVPSRNSIGGVSRNTVLTFGEATLSGSGQYVGIFTGYKPNPLQIVVRLETGFKCSITGDPHIQGFDRKETYHLYQTGDYTVYAVKQRDFLVQIRTWQCTPSVTCICGVVVREKNDIIRLHGCNMPRALALSTLDIPYKLSQGTIVSRSADSRHVGILLPSGSEIKIDIGDTLMNLFIQTPAYDRNQARGICGTNDGNPDNDFTHPDGTVTTRCGAMCLPVPFTESWKVTGSASMFVVAPPQVQEKPPAQFCSCSVNAQGKSEFSCSPREHIQDTKLACNKCPVVTQSLKPSPWGQPGGNEEAQFVHKPVPAVDPNRQWPNDKGITESQAKAMCLAAIRKSQLYSRCQNVGNLAPNAMNECLGDILHGGLTSPLDAVTTSFTVNCQMTLAQDETNFVKTPDGGLALKPDINDLVCALECVQHGKCAPDGTCQCQSGWAGETCQIETARGPIIRSVTGGFLCYESQPSCQSFDFFKSNVDSQAKMKCRLQPVNASGRKIGQPVILDAINESSTKFTCPLPKPVNSLQRYVVSVTADGVKYGNELPLHLYDTTCMDCVGRKCNVKNMTCLIKDVCYQNGERNASNQQEICDARTSQMKWS